MRVRLLEKFPNKKRKYMLIDIVEPFVNKLKSFYKGLDLEYKIIKDKYFGFDDKDQVAIKFIKSSHFGQGPLALQKLCEWADKHQIYLSLCAVDFFGTDIETLIKGYERLGFRSYGSSLNNMIRKPHS